MKRIIAIILAVISIIAILPITAFGGVTDSAGNMVSSLTPPIKITGSETIKSYTVNYTNTDMIPALGNYAGVVIPVTATKAGMLFIDYDIDMLGSSSTYVEMYKESTFNTRIDSDYLSVDQLKGTLELKVPEKGTYYLVLYSHSSTYSDPYTTKVAIKPYIVSKENRTLSNDKWTIAYSDGSTKTYFKFSVSKTCVVTVYSNSINVPIVLTNSKKKNIHDYTVTLDKDNNYRTSYTLKKGTYYICTTGSYDDVYKLKFKTSSFATLKAKEYKKVYQADSDLNMYVKFKATASGYVTIKSKHFSGYVTLCNSSRETLSTKVRVDSESGKTAVFGVAKGKTYYLRLNNYYDYGSICFTNTKVSDQSGSSRSKAKTLSLGKTYKGYIAAGSKTKDWFKFKLSSSKYWAIDIKGATNDVIKVQLYDKNGKLLNSHSYYGGDARLYSYSKAKGTYYVCISRGNTKSSGHYSLKLKTSNSYLG